MPNLNTLEIIGDLTCPDFYTDIRAFSVICFIVT